MLVEESEIKFQIIREKSDLKKIAVSGQAETVILYVSELSHDFVSAIVNHPSIGAVFINLLDRSLNDIDFELLDKFPDELPLFIFLEPNQQAGEYINEYASRTTTLCYCDSPIDIEILQTWVARMYKNRKDVFVRPETSEQKQFAELMLGFDAEGNINLCSEETCRYLGLSASKVFNTDISEWIGSEFKTKEANKQIGKLRNGSKKGKHKRQILPFIGENGNTLFLAAYENYPIGENGQSAVLFHAQNHHELIIDHYHDVKEQYSGLFEFFQDAVLVIDLYGYILFSNEAFTRLFGYPLQEIQTLTAEMLFSSAEQYEKSRQRLLAKQKIQVGTFKKANGELFEGEISYSTFRDHKGKGRGYFLLFRDITERKQLLEDNNRIQERLRRTQEIARLAYWSYNFETSEVEFSDEFFQILSIPKIGRMIDKNVLISEWIFAEDEAIILEFFEKVKAGQLPPGIEFRITSKSDIDYVHMEASDLMRDDQGNVLQVEGILQDISTRKKAEIKNIQKEVQIKQFINDLDGGYARFKIVADDGIFNDAVLLETNSNFEKLLGINPKDVIGKKYSRFIPHTDSEVLQNGIRVALTGRDYEIHNEIFDENRWFDLKIHQPQEGQFVISFYDVTDREKESIKIHKQNKFLLALKETTRDLLTLGDINSILENIVDRAIELVGSTSGFLDFLEPGGTSTYPRVIRGNVFDTMIFPVTRGVGLTGTIWETGIPMLIEDYDEWENRIPGFQTGMIKSVVGVPIFSNNSIIGVLVIGNGYDEGDVFTQADIEILMEFTQMATIAIENAQLLEKLQKEISDRMFIETRLRRSEENFRTLFENIPDGIFRTNVNGDLMAVNPALIKLLGFSSFQDMSEFNVKDFYVDIDERNSFIRTFENDNDTSQSELRLRKKDGTLIYVLENGRAIRDADGNILYFEGTITDITERKEVQQILEKQSNELSRLYRASESLFYDQSTNLEQLAETIVNSVSHEFDQVNCSLFLYDEAEHALRLLALTEFEDECKNIAYIPVSGKAIISRAVRERAVMNVADVSKDEDYLVNWNSSCSELCIPLMLQDQVLGVLNVESVQCDAFNEDDVRLLSIFAEKAAYSLHQSIRNLKEQERFEKLMQIQKLGTELSLLHDEKSILETMLRYLRSISSGSNCIVLVFDYLHSGYRIAAHAGFDDSYQPDAEKIIYNKNLIYHLQQNNIYYSGDLEKVMPSFREVFPESSNEEFVSFTLTNKGEVFGSILLTGEFASSKEDDAIIEVFAKIVSAALTNAQLFRATNLTLERLESLRRIDLAIASSTDINFMVDVLLEQLGGQLHVDASDMLLYSPAGHVFKYCSSSGIYSNRFLQRTVRLGSGQTGKAALDREKIIIKDMTKQNHLDPRLQDMVDEGFVSYIGVPIIAKGAIKGLLEVFHREVLNPPQDWMDYLEIISGQAAIAIETINLFSNLQRSNTDLSLAYDSTLEGWASALELRDKETEGHTRRVAELTIELAVSMNVKPDDLKTIRWGALLHDIGKMGIPDEILLKPGALTEDEWQKMRKHPEYAYELLSQIDYLRHALEIPYCHHEKWDGTGYPRKLKWEEIPLSARIFTIIDVWDALTSDRPYRKAWSEEKAMAYIVEQSGTHFDPRVVEHFQRIMKNRA